MIKNKEEVFEQIESVAKSFPDKDGVVVKLVIYRIDSDVYLYIDSVYRNDAVYKIDDADGTEDSRPAMNVSSESFDNNLRGGEYDYFG